MNNFNHIMVLYIWDKVNFTLGLKDTVKSRVFREYILSFFRESVVKTFNHTANIYRMVIGNFIGNPLSA